jgi:hypothetical protein
MNTNIFLFQVYLKVSGPYAMHEQFFDKTRFAPSWKLKMLKLMLRHYLLYQNKINIIIYYYLCPGFVIVFRKRKDFNERCATVSLFLMRF